MQIIAIVWELETPQSGHKHMKISNAYILQ